MNRSDAVLIWKLSSGQALPQILQLTPGPESLDEACARLPGGAYTTLRTYERTRALHLNDHFARLEETAALSGKTVQLDRMRMRSALQHIVGASPQAQDYRLRIQIDLEQDIGQIYLVRSPLLLLPPESYTQGVAVITSRLHRDNPRAKLTEFIKRQSQEHLPEGINEGLLLDDEGRILEGRSSNFYAVIDGSLCTAGEHILHGITRSIILEEATAAQIPIELQPVALSRLPTFQEAFISSTSRGILPLKQIDHLPVGGGAPGPLTRLLSQRFSARLTRELEEI